MKQKIYYDHVTDFVFIQDEPQPSDVIFIPGSRYGELAIHAAALYREHMAKWVIPSGKFSILQDRFQGGITPEAYAGNRYETECDFFTDLLLDQGVREEAILKERKATFTYENALYSRKLLEEKKIYRNDGSFRAILVCQAFHAKRCLMYYQYVFPETEFFVCPVETRGINRNNWYQSVEKAKVVFGEVERIGKQFAEMRI